MTSFYSSPQPPRFAPMQAAALLTSSASFQYPLMSALKSAVIRVDNLRAAQAFYTGVIGLQVLQEADTIADKARRLWGLQGRQVRCVRLGRPGQSFGLIDLVQLEGGATTPIRLPERPDDWGWATLSFRTNHLENAIAACEAIGARALLPITQRNSATPVTREVQIEFASGERFVLFESGGAQESLPLFTECVATAGLIVPSLPATLAFYRDALGLHVSQTIDHLSDSISNMINAPLAESRTQTVTLSSGGQTNGKFEFRQLASSSGFSQQQNAGTRADGQHLGFWMLSVMTQDLDHFQAACRHAGLRPLRGPATIDRPCYGRVKALILRAPAGELIEVLGPATTKSFR